MPIPLVAIASLPDFETEEKSWQEDRKRAEGFKQALAMIASISEGARPRIKNCSARSWENWQWLDRQAAASLEKRLGAPRDSMRGDSLASSVSMRAIRIRVLDALLLAFTPYADSELCTFTVINRNWCLAPDELDAATAAAIKRQFITHLERAGVTAVSGPLIAFLHGEYEPTSNRYTLHFHGLTTLTKAAALSKLRDVPDKRRWGYRATATGAAPIQRKLVQNRARQVTYLLKSYWPMRPRRLIDGGLKRDRRPTRILEPFASQVLLWLDRHTLGELTVMSGCWSRRSGGSAAMRALYLSIFGAAPVGLSTGPSALENGPSRPSAGSTERQRLMATCNTTLAERASVIGAAPGTNSGGKCGKGGITASCFKTDEVDMNAKSQAPRAMPRQYVQQAHPSAPARQSSSIRVVSAEPLILDGVRDQHGEHWIRYGTPIRNAWVSVPELIANEGAVFRRLSRVAPSIVARRSREAFKSDIEQHPAYRDAHVAAMPGWHGRHYAFGDGSVIDPRDDRSDLIITYEPDAKFTPAGTLAEWQMAVAPLVARQRLPLFVMGLSLVPAVMRFVPAGHLNVLVELVGPKEVGKTILGTLAASLWCGNPNSDCGGGEHWDLTINAFDDLKRRHRDTLLFMDEGNLMGGKPKERADLLKHLVFKAAGTAGKRRYGDPAVSEHGRFALLSTTNEPLGQLCAGTSADVQALLSRMVTILIPSSRPHGLFDHVPQGYATVREASEALRGIADQQWGSVARHFVAWLAAQDEARLRAKIESWLTQYRAASPAAERSARISKSFALIAVAGELAQRSGTLPNAWGSILQAVRAVETLAALPSGEVEPTAEERLMRYVADHQGSLIDAASLTQPLTLIEFDKSPGVLVGRLGNRELLIAPKRFHSAFQDTHLMLKALQAKGRVRGEGGKNPKLQTKPSRSVCVGGRAYRLRIE